MRKLAFIFSTLCIAGCVVSKPPESHADYFQYPCNYPFIGTGADVQIIVHGGGQYCDGPMEINGSHYHCESGGGGVGGGAIGLAPLGPLTLGGFGGSGIGANIGDCHWKCPDNSVAPPPNPPGAWVKHLVIDEKFNDCRDHMAPAGIDSAPQSPESGPDDAAGKPVSPSPLP